jgi:dynein heavy chain
VIFSNLLKLESEDKLYEEITNVDDLHKQLSNLMFEYNLSHQNKMDLVFFSDAVNHICRIVRVLLQPRGNMMLIGVSGCGKQSLTKLASFMIEYASFQIRLSKNYKASDFRDDLKVKMLDSG